MLGLGVSNLRFYLALSTIVIEVFKAVVRYVGGKLIRPVRANIVNFGVHVMIIGTHLMYELLVHVGLTHVAIDIMAQDREAIQYYHQN